MTNDPKRAMARAEPWVTLRVGATALELVHIPPGRFQFGSAATEPGRRPTEVPVRPVTISRGFYLGRTPVTQAQWRAVMGSIPHQPLGDDLPVAQVSYGNALQFCARLTTLTGARVRLPTEAEWEYACRAGTLTRYWSGDGEADLARVGWYRGNADGRAHAVGEKPANPWGLSDMHGNVWQYTADAIQDFESLSAVDPVGARTDWQGGMRGGGWMHDADSCRCAARLVSDDMFGGAGLRVAVDP
jgi:formylglycine-generating enzyme required for sulfatase activity